MIEHILSPQTIEALGWTLLHSLWQGATFAILLALIFIALRSYTAQSRYVVAVGLLCAFFLTVSATFWQQWQQADNQSDLAVLPMREQSKDDIFTRADSDEKALLLDNEAKSAALLNYEITPKNQSTWMLSFRNYYERHLPLLVTIWFLGVLFLQLRFLGQLAYVQRLKHYGTQLFPATWNDRIEELEGKLRIQKKVSYLTSLRIESPMVIGWLKPVVLLPRTLLTSLSETEIYAVLAHELAHIRREDFIVNLMQTFLCNVFFFHPGVWWMSNRIDDEREHCCDDLAVAATGPAVSYAKTLINVSELQLKMQGNTPLAMALSGKNSKRERGGFAGRIRRLFTVKNGKGTFREGFATACILITALMLGVAATGSTIEKTKTKTITKTALDTEKKTLTEPEKVEEASNPNVSTLLHQDELPVANPEEPASPVEAVTPASLGLDIRTDDTRIDALIMACREGDIDFVKTLVKSGIDVNGIGSNGFAPLMVATREDEAEIIAYLIKNGAEVNKSYNGWTALIEAADEGSLASMKHLLKAGADVNYYWTQDSPTAISMAASEGHLKCLKLLLSHGADINGTGKSIPPLHIAAGEDRQEIIDFLITQKIKINKKDADGRTALMYASAEGNPYVVEKLIKAGADISIVDPDGATARDHAEEEGQFYTKEILGIEQRPDIHQATIDGHIEKVKRMVKKGTDVDTRDAHGQTALHLAAAKNHNNDVLVLINLGADINAQDNDGRTPMMLAAADGKEDAVVLLVSRQANMNIADNDGKRAYEWARFGENEGLTSFLGLITEKKPRTSEKEKRKEQEKDYKAWVQLRSVPLLSPYY